MKNFDVTFQETDEQVYCVEYSEYSSANGLFPFHLGTMKDAITHNLQDMYYNNRGANKWQVVFVGSLQECSHALEQLAKNKKSHAKKAAQQKRALDASPMGAPEK